MQPFHRSALVPYLGHIVPIDGYCENGEHGYVYLLSIPMTEGGKQVHTEIPHAVLVANIAAQAHYHKGQKLLIGTVACDVLERKWNFTKGEVIYFIGKDRAKFGGGHWIAQEKLFQTLYPEEVERPIDTRPDFYATRKRTEANLDF